VFYVVHRAFVWANALQIAQRWPAGKRRATRHYAPTTTGRPPCGFQGVRQKIWSLRRVSSSGTICLIVLGLPGRLAMPVQEFIRNCGLHHSLGL
jgi:hypothetical protein